MKRREPTRIELKLDDIQEYEQMKREMELRKGKAGGHNSFFGNEANSSSPNAGDHHDPNAGKTRSEVMRRRIGYDPSPKS